VISINAKTNLNVMVGGKNVKLLFVDFNHSYGGGQVYLRNVLNKLNEKNIQLWVISNNPQNFFEDLNISSAQLIKVNNAYSSFINIAKIINKLLQKENITGIVFNGNRAMYLSPFVMSNNKTIITHTMPTFNKGIKRIITKFATKRIYPQHN